MTSQPPPSGKPAAPAAACAQRRLTRAERLVGIGFRCWLAGFDRGDIHCWTIGWEHYAATLGPQRARLVAPELASWVRTVRAHAARPIQICALDCGMFSPDEGSEFCRDECMAIAIVAASQHPACPVLQACAAALTGAAAVDEVLEATRKFGRALASAGVVLDRGGLAWRTAAGDGDH